jgi:TolB-like protein
MSMIDELRRRNVVRMAGLYLVAAWLLVQVTSTVLPMFEAPGWLPRSIVIALAVGFVPALVFSWVFELTPEGLKRETPASSDQAVEPRAGRRLDRVVMVMLALAVGYFCFDRYVLQPSREANLIEQANATAAKEASARARAAKMYSSIAVLPFDNRTGDRAQDYFADGLTDELTTTLARISGLKVIARASSAHYKGSAARMSQIGKELGVGALVSGSVLRSGGRVRYNAELVSTESEETLWAEKYERDEKDVLTLQAEVATAIANAIAVRLSPEEATRLASAGSVDPQALDEYLRGRSLWNQRTEATVREALRHFERATRIAPDFALGFAGLADAYIILGVYGYDPPREAFPLAKAAAQHAIALDPGAGEPHASLGDILFHYDWNWDESAREHQRAIALAPGFATAYHWGSEADLLRGDRNGALDRIKHARSLDPLSMVIRSYLAQTLAIAGRRDESIVELRDALALDPLFPRTRRELARQLLAAGHRDEALAEARKLVATAPDDVQALATLGLCLGANSQTDEARALLAQLDDRSKTRFVSAYERARVTAGLGDREATLRYLEQAVATRDGFLPFLAYDFEFDFLRKDARFAEISAQVGGA